MAEKFFWIGNHLSLDFINTEMIERGVRTDLIEGVADFVGWCVQARILSTRQGKDMVRTWGGHPEGGRALRQAREFRAMLRGTIERIVTGKPVPATAVVSLNERLHQRSGRHELVRAQGRFERRFCLDCSQVSHLLVPLAESAVELLCANEFSLIRKCRNDACILYFYDTTKNHARQWCSMGLCGNRVKVAAHYRRKKKGG